MATIYRCSRCGFAHIGIDLEEAEEQVTQFRNWLNQQPRDLRPRKEPGLAWYMRCTGCDAPFWLMQEGGEAPRSASPYQILKPDVKMFDGYWGRIRWESEDSTVFSYSGPYYSIAHAIAELQLEANKRGEQVVADVMKNVTQVTLSPNWKEVSNG